MQYRRLGSSGLKVSRLCLGTNMVGGYVDDEGSAQIVDAFLDAGGNFIDTSDNYNEGRSEEVLGRICQGEKRQRVVVATKFGMRVIPGSSAYGASRRYVMDAVEASLRRLRTDYIDLYQVHQWDPETPLEETMRALDDLVRSGKVRYIGCSNFAAWQICKSLWISDMQGLERFVSVQPQYNFLDRRIETEVVPLALDQGVGIIPYQVLLSGMVSGKYRPGQEPPPGSRMASRPLSRQRHFNDRSFTASDRLHDVTQRFERDPVQATLAWALAKPGVTSVIVGASGPEQVRTNAAAVDIALSAEEIQALDAIGAGA